MNMTLAPIVLFAHRRPDHVGRTLRALAANPEARECTLIVFVDGPRSAAEVADVARVTDRCANAPGFGSIEIHASPDNKGLSRSIVDGLNRVFVEHESAVVLEDDLEVAPVFLRYVNAGLRRYWSEDSVISIHGHVYDVRKPLPEAFFVRGADCWGWATWRRGWSVFQSDASSLLAQIHVRGAERDFDFDGSFPYLRMLQAQAEGRIDSWAIRWYASAFLSGQLTLYPGRSLVRNIGQDGSGTHGDVGVQSTRRLPTSVPNLEGLRVEESDEGRAAFIDYFRREQRLDRKVRWELRQWRRRMMHRRESPT